MPLITKRVVTQRDLNGASLGVTTTADGYDALFGNLTTQSVTRSAAVGGVAVHTLSVATTYKNDELNWLIGLPEKITTTALDPAATGSTSVTRTVDFTYTAATGLLDTKTVEAGTAALRVLTTYDRSGNSFGLVNKTIESWLDPYQLQLNASNLTLSKRTVSDITYDAKGRFPVTMKTR